MFRAKTDIRNKKGGALALIAVSLTGLLAATSLAIDLGMFMTARSEAQRVADAAALAGGSAFLTFWADSATADSAATTRAMEYATNNQVRGRLIPPEDVAVEVLFSEEKVRVFIRRLGMGTWFGRFAGVFSDGVSARAAAQAVPSDGPTCVKPWAIPDLWEELVDPDGGSGGGQWVPNSDSLPGNIGPPETPLPDGQWQAGEGVWNFEPVEGETYGKYGDPGVPVALQTGYGSNWRYNNPNAPWPGLNDWGLPVTVKPSDPNDQTTISSPYFFVFQLDSTKGGGGSQYREDIETCSSDPIFQSPAEYPIEPGNMIGPTNQGVNNLLDLDFNAYWDDLTNQPVASPEYPVIESSPRVITVALFDPNLIAGLIGGGGPGTTWIEFNNFAKFFIEKSDKPSGHYSGPSNIKLRFMGFATGTSAGGNGGTLIKRLQLVE